MKILTVCRAGLVRSVSLANILKLHFQPVDVLACGVGKHEFGRMNSEETLEMLFRWAEKIVVMEERYKEDIFPQYRHKVLVCEVGPDTYGSPTNPDLIDKAYRWVRKNEKELGIYEHQKLI